MRQFLTIVLPLILPFLVYALYLSMARRRVRVAGGDELPAWQKAPWQWIFVAGVLLMLTSLIVFRQFEGVPAGTELAPTRLEQGGQVTPMPVE